MKTKLKISFVICLLFVCIFSLNKVSAVGTVYTAIKDGETLIYRTVTKVTDSVPQKWATRMGTSVANILNKWISGSKLNVSPSFNTYNTEAHIFSKQPLAEYEISAKNELGYLAYNSAQLMQIDENITDIQELIKGDHVTNVYVEDKYFYGYDAKNPKTITSDLDADEFKKYNSNLLGELDSTSSTKYTYILGSGKGSGGYPLRVENTYNIKDAEYEEYRRLIFKDGDSYYCITDVIIDEDTVEALKSTGLSKVYVSKICSTDYDKSLSGAQKMYFLTPGALMHGKTNNNRLGMV